MKNIAIFGGTFNPIHKVHIELIKAVKDLDFIDEVLVIPTKIPPHKVCKDIASAKDRLAMCNIATKAFNNVFVSDIEIKREGKSYTFDTVNELKSQKSGQFYFVCGADMIITFDTWYKYEQILGQVKLIAVRRGGYKDNEFNSAVLKLKGKGADIFCLDFSPIEVSSTQIRTAIKQGRDTSGYLTAEIADYIRENNLYIG